MKVYIVSKIICYKPYHIYIYTCIACIILFRVFSCLLSKNFKLKVLKTIILPVVMYECETWSVTLWKEHRLKVFENRVLRRILGSKWDEVTGGWRKLHNELHNVYASPNIVRVIKSRRMRCVGQVAYTEEQEMHVTFWLGNLKRKKSLEEA